MLRYFSVSLFTKFSYLNKHTAEIFPVVSPVRRLVFPAFSVRRRRSMDVTRRDDGRQKGSGEYFKLESQLNFIFHIKKNQPGSNLF